MRRAATLLLIVFLGLMPVTAQEVTMRRLPADTPYTTSVSADGRYLSHGYPLLVLIDLATGERLLPVDEERTDEWRGGFFDWTSLSRDAEQVAFVFYNGATWDLRVSDIDDFEPRVLHTSRGDGYTQPMSWSPDGREIAAVLSRADRVNQIAVFPVEGGPPRVLKTFDWRWPGGPRYSPDGRFIAYDFPETDDTRSRDIWILAADGSAETRVVESPGDDRLLDWLPDGSGILLSSDRSGTPDWWTLPLIDGRPGGAPSLLKAEMWETRPLGFTDEGAFYYQQTVGRRELHLASFDPETWTPIDQPRRVSGRYSARGTMRWSPDGNIGAFLTPLRDGVDTPSRVKVVLASIHQGTFRELETELRYISNNFAWEDAGTLLVTGQDERNRAGLYRVDIQSGDVETVLQGALPRGLALSSDRKTAYFHRREAPEGVVAYDLRTGEERLLTPPDRAFQLAVRPSPDGSQLLLTSYWQDAVLVLPTAGGTPREVVGDADCRGPRSECEGAFSYYQAKGWSADGDHVIVGRRTGDVLEVLRVAIDDGSTALLATCTIPDRHPCNGQLSPDGQRAVFGVGQERFETWVMENIPSARAAVSTGSR